MGVYRIGGDGELERLITDMRKPNGVAISPDGARLYVSESDNGANHARALPRGAPLPRGDWMIYAYPLNGSGPLGPRAVFADLADVGQPDGMTVDTAGNLYVALARPRPGVVVFAPDGRRLALIPMAAPVTNVEFGRGTARRLLYIAAGRGLYRIRLRAEGFRFAPRRRVNRGAHP
jgi:gluconolactonase